VPEAYTPQEYLPESLAGAVYYEPGPFGFEREVAKRLGWWRELRARLEGRGDPDPDVAPPATANASSPGGDAERSRTGTAPADSAGGSPLEVVLPAPAQDVPSRRHEPRADDPGA
jgi:hypothetical protein